MTATLLQQQTARAVSGLFEGHVTVRCAGEGQFRELASWCRAEGLKLTSIVLARGRQRFQPMLTFAGEGSPADQHAAAARVANGLRDAGFEPVRVKIEVAPWADGVPQSDAEAQDLGPARYFEHHVKLDVSPDDSLDRLAELVAPHRAHLSWNARRVRTGGHHERFVTQRCHDAGLPRATHRLAALLADLRGDGRTIMSVEQEYVVHDSNTALDDGWIDLEVRA